MKGDKMEFPFTKRSAILVGLIMILILSFYLWRFGHLGYGDQEVLGQFGDYFGGVLNPILSFFAFLVLIRTYRAQIESRRSDDRKHTEVLENSRFFEMISMLNQLASSVEVDVSRFDFGGPTGDMRQIKTTYTGHRAIGRCWNILCNMLGQVTPGDSRHEDLISKYLEWEDIYWPSIESYYDSAIFIIDEYAHNQSDANTRYFMSALKSQMSSNERNILYIFTMRGQQGAKTAKILDSIGYWATCDDLAIELGNVRSDHIKKEPSDD